MIKVAICDDNQLDRNNIKKIIEGYDFYVEEFSSGEELLEKIDSTYDLIFLDILMKELDGIETMNYLSRKKIDAKIIFVSSFDNRIRELFGHMTIAFVDKPIDVIEFNLIIEKAFTNILKEKNEMFEYATNGKKYSLPHSEIKYFEAHRNETIAHTTSINVSFYSSLVKIWEKVDHRNEFAFVSKNVIVNLRYATIKSNTAVIDNREFKIGRNYKTDVLIRYANMLRYKD